jgi:hypothetical protein
MKPFILLITILSLALIICTPMALRADHGLFPIYNVTHLKTSDGDAYNFYSPGFNYTFNAKKRFGFFSSLSVLWPLRSNQNGESFKNADYYDRKYGFDLMLGAGGKIPAGERLLFVISPGAHLNMIRLRGKELYQDFTNMSLGLGLNLQARYAVSRCIDGTLFTSGSWDFIDPIHQENRLKNGFVVTFGLGLTF